MKQMTCEMCGSTDLMKQDGVFVCQACGCKYSVEEAKKMMIEGTVDVTGSTVKIDTSSELKNLYELARRAKTDNNSENAKKYYDQILVKDPSNWEANFYSVYYQSMSCTIAEIQSAAIRLSNCVDTVLYLIRDNVSDPVEQEKAVTEVCTNLMRISGLLFNAATDHYKSIDASIRHEYKQELIDNWCAVRDISYNCGNYLISIFGELYGVHAAAMWKVGVCHHSIAYKQLSYSQKEQNKAIIESYVPKIKKYLPSYQPPVLETEKTSTTSGCYVATAVYGSYDCPPVWTLRRYRDYTLAKTWYGRAFIHVYYAISPTLVDRFGHTDWFKNMWRGKLDRMVKDLQAQGVESTPYEDREW